MSDILFSEALKRSSLLGLKQNSGNKTVRINVYRNHSFEMVESVLPPFLNFSGLSAVFDYSDYDDSLNFQEKQECDLNIVWLDLSRYKQIDVAGWLIERMAVLRGISKSPILLLYTGDLAASELNGKLTDFYAFSILDSVKNLNGAEFDLAKEAYSGTRLSNKACLLCARVVGMKYIPGVLQPALKAVIVDLDNTLYQGILGEDGIDKLELTAGHKELQERLKSLKEQGFFLCVASKNDEDDVKSMFRQRTDFPLKWDDFTAAAVNWTSKAENILYVAKKLNIGTDAVLFIDDNPAEIQNVLSAGLGVKTVLASSPSAVLQTLNFYPGLMKLKSSNEDKIRSADIQANEERARLAASCSQEEYFKKLGIKLVFCVNPESQIPRIAELLGKTNQFILTYKRYKETEVTALMKNPASCIITISMSDNLSDSGVIAIFAGHKEKEGLLVLDEMTVSCRALGRNLENVMLPKMFMIAREHLKTSDNMLINYKKGSRNKPALDWLEISTKRELEKESDAIEYVLEKSIKTDGLDICIR